VRNTQQKKGNIEAPIKFTGLGTVKNNRESQKIRLIHKKVLALYPDINGDEE
jgi:hypothetical protein